MSVLFINTRTRLPYNEREIFYTAGSEADSVLKISSNIQFEFTAGDSLAMASRPTCLGT